MAAVLVLGTRNRKKREELAEILDDLGLDLHDLTAWPDAPEVVENGATFAANAQKKAAELARCVGHWVIGEDSGLVVPASMAGRASTRPGTPADTATTTPTTTVSWPSWRHCPTTTRPPITFAPQPWPTRKARSMP